MAIDVLELIKAYNDYENFPTLASVAQHLKICERTLHRRMAKLKLAGHELIDRRSLYLQTQQDKSKKIKEEKPVPEVTFEERIEIRKLKDDIAKLTKELREAEKNALTSDHVTNIIHPMLAHTHRPNPDWLVKKTSKNTTKGIPCLFLSDVHLDEYVDPAQINYVNSYNREIAIKRLQHTFNTVIDILFNKTVNPKYDGFVLALGGDLLSGNIHEELAETNEDAIARSLLLLLDLLIDGINLLLSKIDRVFIPCVVGNHGRLHKKPRAKNKVFDNYEWLLYKFLQRHFLDNKRVSFLIPDGPDAHFRIYDQNFLLTHGDQFKGGNAIAGIFSPLMLGFHKKQKKQASINKSFDVMLVAHFHQYVHTNQIVINGSVKGYDEFANLMNFPFERPQQALFLNHPENGMVIRTPILCDSYEALDSNIKELEGIA